MPGLNFGKDYAFNLGDWDKTYGEMHIRHGDDLFVVPFDNPDVAAQIHEVINLMMWVAVGETQMTPDLLEVLEPFKAYK